MTQFIHNPAGKQNWEKTSLFEIWSFPQSEFIILTNCVLKLNFSITHCPSFHSNPSFPEVSHRTQLTPVHPWITLSKSTPNTLLLEYKHVDDTWYFSGPLCACTLFALALSLCLHFLSFAPFCSLLTLSTHSSFHKLALVFVFKSACGFTQ